MRRTSLERVRPTVTLKGNKVHPLPFNPWSRVELGKDGKDEFSFEVPTQVDVAFALTNGMQGRLYLVGADNQLKPVETIAPMTPDLTRPQGVMVPRVRTDVADPRSHRPRKGKGESEEQYEEPPPEPSVCGGRTSPRVPPGSHCR